MRMEKIKPVNATLTLKMSILSEGFVCNDIEAKYYIAPSGLLMARRFVSDYAQIEMRKEK